MKSRRTQAKKHSCKQKNEHTANNRKKASDNQLTALSLMVRVARNASSLADGSSREVASNRQQLLMKKYAFDIMLIHSQSIERGLQTTITTFRPDRAVVAPSDRDSTLRVRAHT